MTLPRIVYVIPDMCQRKFSDRMIFLWYTEVTTKEVAMARENDLTNYFKQLIREVIAESFGAANTFRGNRQENNDIRKTRRGRRKARGRVTDPSNDKRLKGNRD
jgi:hypothetical protein